MVTSWACWSLLAVMAAPTAAVRRAVPLDGTWELCADPEDRGVREAWFAEPTVAWPTVAVPAAWEATLGNGFDGVGWYRRRCPVPTGYGRYLLRCWGAATQARVWVNGHEVGQHLGAWTPFTLDVTAAVTPGRPAVVVIRLDERVGHNTQGFLPIIAPHFGGLWQSAELLCLPGAWLDDTATHLTATWHDGLGSLQVAAPVRGATADLSVAYTLWAPDGTRLVQETHPAGTPWTWQGRVEPWAVGQPRLGRLEVALRRGTQVLDSFSRHVGFRSVRADGRRILLNGQPLQVRGVLTWGYDPPSTAPYHDPARFRRLLAEIRARGFNLVKFCLWMPPQALLDAVDEAGLLAWVEYPTWHPKLDAAHRDELLREYAEFGCYDGWHPSVIVRSLTCETGPSADLAVLQALYDQAKRAAPETLVEDDSSWIGWNRIHDVWDDHSYGNNRWWRGQLASLDQHVREHGTKPLLLGEAIAADTWADTAALAATLGPADLAAAPWWRPKCWEAQLAFERRLRDRWAAADYDPVADLREASLRYAQTMRRWQIETYRDRLPEAGYVVSVVRDFTLARMGLYDDLDQPKWSAEEWAWHGEQTHGLLAAGDQRAFVGGEADTLGPHVQVPGDTPVPYPRRKRIGGEQGWDLWALPRPEPVPPGTLLLGHPAQLSPLFAGAATLPDDAPIPPGTPLVVTTTLNARLLAWLAAGGHVLHLPDGSGGAFKTEGTWWLRGTVWAPPQPPALADRVPRDLLSYLQLFELGGEGVVRGERLWDEVDPLLTFLETHDLDRVRPNLLLFDTRVGQGRLVVSALRHGGPDNVAGMWLARELAHWLLTGPLPGHALQPATLAALAEAVDGETLRLEGPWQFATDPKVEGLAAGWHQPAFDDRAWQPVVAASPEESRIWNSYDGWGWYRRRVAVPAAWRGRRIRVCFDSVDDMYQVFVNGRLAGGYGKQDRSESSYLRRTWVDVTPYLEPGRDNLLVVRVYDWVGSGGIGREALLTTGPVEPGLDLLVR